jgi:hypothetical protein
MTCTLNGKMSIKYTGQGQQCYLLQRINASGTLQIIGKIINILSLQMRVLFSLAIIHIHLHLHDVKIHYMLLLIIQ